MSKKKAIDPVMFQEEHENKIYTFLSELNDYNDLKTNVLQLSITEDEKIQIIDDIQKLSLEDGSKILNSVLNKSIDTMKNINIKDLMHQFETLETNQDWSKALNILDLILELAELQGYQIIIEKLIAKYQTIKLKAKSKNTS